MLSARRPRAPRERGLRLIITYKLAKGVAQCLVAAALVAMMALGYGPEVVHLAAQVRHHASAAWSVRLANFLVALASPHRLWEVVLAFVLDGVFTIFEGVSLVRGWWWGPWLVVIATGSLLPFEIVALIEHRHAGRLVLLIINVAIVAYLVARARRERGNTRGKSRE